MNTIAVGTLPFAEGRTAEIYAWEPGYILKLYREWCPGHWVEHEARVARTICAAGINSPAVKDIVEVMGRRGIVYERVEGVSMLVEMSTRPWTILRHARELAELQASYIGLSIPGLESYRSSLGGAILNTTQLPEDLRRKALNYLSMLPDENTLCHGDFHPGNVLMTPRGPVIIDWMTACAGSPWADVARTIILITVGPKGDSKQLSPLLRLFVRVFYVAYFDRIKQLIPEKEHEHERWLPAVAAARLNEEIKPEREALIAIVQSALP
jgi:tRNA A-37 threonylcarbamoyl transferase component Bud32